MLSEQQIEHFQSQGYLVIENLVDEATIKAVYAEYAQLLDELYSGWYNQGFLTVAPEKLSFWQKLDECYQNCAGKFDWYQPLDISLPHADITEETPMHFGPAVFDLATHYNILDMVEQLIGPEITSNPIQHIRIKPPQRAVPKEEVRAHIVSTDWHQDQGVTLEEADQTEMVTVWLAMTDATVENGCLQVAPGKSDELLPHCTKIQTGIADAFIPHDRAVPTPVKAGGAVVFHPMTPHASLENKSDGYRWSFDLRYNVTGQPTGRSHFPEFIARSKANPASELKDWRVWKQMWEQARYQSAHGVHIPQHRWGNDAPYCA